MRVATLRNRRLHPLLFLLAFAACGDSTGPDLRISTIVIEPAEPSLAVGESVTLTATPKDATGRTVEGVSMRWEVEDGSVARITQGGVLTGLAEGSTTVRALGGGRTGSTEVTVTAAPAQVATVELDAETLELEEGGTRTLVATARDADGEVVTGRAVQWTTSDPLVAHVDAVGRVTAFRVGEATITAKVDGQSASATLQVTADYAYDLLFDRWSGVAGEAPELYRLDIRAADAVAEPVRPGAPAALVSPSPDGTRMAFVAFPDGHPQIYVADIDGTNAVRLTTSAARDEEPAWSPDGSRILFRRWDPSTEGAHADIWSMAPDGSDLVNLTEGMGQTNQQSPAWSPDGTRIVFSSETNDAAGAAHLWTMNADGTDPQQLTDGDVYDAQPAWSPDGTTIVFTRTGVQLGARLHLVDVGDGQVRALIGAPTSAHFAPAWMPDGRLIAFSAKVGDVHQLFTVWSDGSILVQRTFDETDKNNPAWVVRQP